MEVICTDKNFIFMPTIQHYCFIYKQKKLIKKHDIKNQSVWEKERCFKLENLCCPNFQILFKKKQLFSWFFNQNFALCLMMKHFFLECETKEWKFECKTLIDCVRSAKVQLLCALKRFKRHFNLTSRNIIDYPFCCKNWTCNFMHDLVNSYYF